MQASEFLQLNCFTLDGMTTVIPIKFPQSKLSHSRFACSRRPASLRLGLETESLDPWFLALAPVHPACSQRLKRYALLCCLLCFFHSGIITLFSFQGARPGLI